VTEEIEDLKRRVKRLLLKSGYLSSACTLPAKTKSTRRAVQKRKRYFIAKNSLGEIARNFHLKTEIKTHHERIDTVFAAVGIPKCGGVEFDFASQPPGQIVAGYPWTVDGHQGVVGGENRPVYRNLLQAQDKLGDFAIVKVKGGIADSQTGIVVGGNGGFGLEKEAAS